MARLSIIKKALQDLDNPPAGPYGQDVTIVELAVKLRDQMLCDLDAEIAAREQAARAIKKTIESHAHAALTAEAGQETTR